MKLTVQKPQKKKKEILDKGWRCFHWFIEYFGWECAWCKKIGEIKIMNAFPTELICKECVANTKLLEWIRKQWNKDMQV